jgi:Dit-like phage tail protein
MASVAVVYAVKRTTIQGASTSALEVDATLSEQMQLDTDVTDYPVEEGFNIADGIRNKPVSLTLDCIVSNTPILQSKDAQDAGGFRKGDGDGAGDEALALLQQLRDAEDVVRVVTRLKDYKSMAITSIKVSRDPKTGDVLTFNVALKQVRIVSSKFVSYPREPRGTKKNPLGEKGKKNATPAQSKSVLAKAADAIKARLGKP